MLFNYIYHLVLNENGIQIGYSVCGEHQSSEVESRTQGSRPRTAIPKTDPVEARTGMLEAKAKDQGHNAEMISKK